MSWERIAKKHIKYRSYSDVAEIWSRSFGDKSRDEPALDELLKSMFRSNDFDFKESSHVRSMPGSISAGIAEIIRIRDKAIAASEGACSLYKSGRPSWGSVDAYHAGFLSAKLLLATFGIFHVSIEGRNFFLDILPHLGDREYTKEFSKQTRQIEFPVRFMTVNGARIEHRHVWEMLSRIARVCSIEPFDERETSWFKNFDFSDYSSIRNKIIYNGYYWTELNDLRLPLAEVEDIESHEMVISFWNNLWKNHQLRDHMFLAILSGFIKRLFPLNRELSAV